MIVRAIDAHPTIAYLDSSVSIRCPACRQVGKFDRFPPTGQGTQFYDSEILTAENRTVTGLRLCPNLSCRTLIFFIWDSTQRKLAVTYPSERLDFDSTNIPASVTKAMEEAITWRVAQVSLLRPGIGGWAALDSCTNEGAPS